MTIILSGLVGGWCGASGELPDVQGFLGQNHVVSRWVEQYAVTHLINLREDPISASVLTVGFDKRKNCYLSDHPIKAAGIYCRVWPFSPVD